MDQSHDSPEKRFALPARLRKAALWAAGLLAAYTLLGFLVVPPLARAILENKLGEVLHRQVAIEGIRFNPFTLAADVGGFRVSDGDGHEILGFDALHADLQALSVVRGGPVLRELRLEGPRIAVTRLQETRYDISDLIDDWTKPSEDTGTPAFSVSNIQLAGGRLTLVDRPAGVTHTVADLSLNLPFISSLPNDVDIFVEPHFSAVINGAPLVLEGRSKPFAQPRESELDIDLDRVELKGYLPYLPRSLPFALQGGRLDARLKLVFKQGGERPAALFLAGDLQVRDLALAEAGGAPLLAWKELDVRVKEADLLNSRFAIDAARLAGLSADVRLTPEGRLNWLELAERLAAPAGKGPSPAKSAAPAWSVREIRIRDGRLRFQDQGRPQQATQVVDRIEAGADGLSSQAGSPFKIAVAARVNEQGDLKAGGEVRLQPLTAELDLDFSGLSLLPFQPYFADHLNLTLTSGELSGQGRLSLKDDGGGLGGGFKGQVTVGDLRSLDKESQANFLRWKSLFVGDIDARLRPLALSVGEVALTDFYARVVLSPQGKLNLTQIVRSGESEAAAPPAGKATGEGKAQVAVAPPSKREPLPLSIGKVSLQGGTVNFSDYFVRPNYTVNVTRITGRVSGLSSDPGTRADLELRGNYGKAAPVQVTARLNPLAAKTYLDLKGEIRGVDLTTLSTYSGKYAGYAIEQGKLSLFVTYKLEDNLLTADNRVFLDQLTFGERVDSPDATSLPVKLAVALLKNSRGEIDVNLPVSGSIDDPEFSLGGIVARVIGNLLVRAVTSPFALLGSVFGGGEELSHIEFAAGRATLAPAALERLETLARALGERPALKLEIAGRADPGVDREGLKRVALERAVKAEKLRAADADAPPASLRTVVVAPEEYPEYLRRAYKEAKFPKPRNLVGLPKNLPVEEMEKLMLANFPVGEEDLRRLALRRAEAAQAWLVDEGKVPIERVFLLAPRVAEEGEKDKGAPARADFSLR